MSRMRKAKARNLVLVLLIVSCFAGAAQDTGIPWHSSEQADSMCGSTEQSGSIRRPSRRLRRRLLRLRRKQRSSKKAETVPGSTDQSSATFSNTIWKLLDLFGSYSAAIFSAFSAACLCVVQHVYKPMQARVDRRRYAARQWSNLFHGTNSVTREAFTTQVKNLPDPDIRYLINDGFSVKSLAAEIDENQDGFVSRTEFVNWRSDNWHRLRPDMSGEETHTVFVGRAGVGKSTLINSFIGRAELQAGLATTQGFGVTEERYDIEKVWRPATRMSIYPNLPGFLETERELDHLDLIERAVKGHWTKLIFVVRFEANRVPPDEQIMISHTLDRLRSVESYAIIVNKCSQPQMDMYRNQSQQQALATTLTKFVRRCLPLPKLLFLPRLRELDDKKNLLIHDFHPDIFDKVRLFVCRVPPNNCKNDELSVDLNQHFDRIQEIGDQRNPPGVLKRCWRSAFGRSVRGRPSPSPKRRRVSSQAQSSSP